MRTNLRQLRIQKGISQTYISKKLGYKYASGYGNIEMGRNRLSLENASIIADILGVTVDELAKDDHLFRKKLHVKCKTNKSA